MRHRLQATPSTSVNAPAKRPAGRTVSDTHSRKPAAGSNGDRATRITPQDREQMIATAAYFRAQIRGFEPGSELQDWLEAEVEVDRLITR